MEKGATRYGEETEKHGFSPTHHQIVAWVPPKSRVLEIGCATGYVGRALQIEKGCKVTGLEIDPAAAEIARQNGLEVHVGSLESQAFRDSIVGKFDVVIAADVLEHLADPGPALEHFKKWLAPGGVAIIAVPNIATWQMRAQLFFRGDFEYQETGIMDRTHLHHFTWETIHKLVASQGWRIEDTMIDGWEIPFAHTFFFTVPDRVMRANQHAEEDSNPIRRFARLRAFKMAANVYTVGEALGRFLTRRAPNLTAPHVALLIRPD
jgi:methionine biosynthesis protein MetW